jgi:hypothetical protein
MPILESILLVNIRERAREKKRTDKKKEKAKFSFQYCNHCSILVNLTSNCDKKFPYMDVREIETREKNGAKERQRLEIFDVIWS